MCDSSDFSADLVPFLASKGLTLACAESCTGGLLAKVLTDVPGSSRVVWGGVVVYSNDAKTRLLGVEPALITSHGAVSSAVAAAMAEGMRGVSGADLSVAITGIAGPEGGSLEKPVGTVFIAVCGPLPQTRRFHFSGNRDEIRKASVNAAMDMIRTAGGYRDAERA